LKALQMGGNFVDQDIHDAIVIGLEENEAERAIHESASLAKPNLVASQIDDTWHDPKRDQQTTTAPPVQEAAPKVVANLLETDAEKAQRDAADAATGIRGDRSHGSRTILVLHHEFRRYVLESLLTP
jgi:hypothetical protein